MTVLGLNHVNIRTTEIARTVAFYTTILGFRYGGREQVNGFDRNWLLDGSDQPVIHLREIAPEARSTGPIDHVALDCTDLTATIKRLDQAGIDYAVVDHVIQDVTQIFLQDVNGVPLELSFAMQDARLADDTRPSAGR